MEQEVAEVVPFVHICRKNMEEHPYTLKALRCVFGLVKV